MVHIEYCFILDEKYISFIHKTYYVALLQIGSVFYQQIY